MSLQKYFVRDMFLCFPRITVLFESVMWTEIDLHHCNVEVCFGLKNAVQSKEIGLGERENMICIWSHWVVNCFVALESWQVVKSQEGIILPISQVFSCYFLLPASRATACLYDIFFVTNSFYFFTAWNKIRLNYNSSINTEFLPGRGSLSPPERGPLVFVVHPLAPPEGRRLSEVPHQRLVNIKHKNVVGARSLAPSNGERERQIKRLEMEEKKSLRETNVTYLFLISYMYVGS